MRGYRLAVAAAALCYGTALQNSFYVAQAHAELARLSMSHAEIDKLSASARDALVTSIVAFIEVAAGSNEAAPAPGRQQGSSGRRLDAFGSEAGEALGRDGAAAVHSASANSGTHGTHQASSAAQALAADAAMAAAAGKTAVFEKIIAEADAKREALADFRFSSSAHALEHGAGASSVADVFSSMGIPSEEETRAKIAAHEGDAQAGLANMASVMRTKLLHEAGAGSAAEADSLSAKVPVLTEADALRFRATPSDTEAEAQARASAEALMGMDPVGKAAFNSMMDAMAGKQTPYSSFSFDPQAAHGASAPPPPPGSNYRFAERQGRAEQAVMDASISEAEHDAQAAAETLQKVSFTGPFAQAAHAALSAFLAESEGGHATAEAVAGSQALRFAAARGSAPGFDASTGLTEPTAKCKRILNSWLGTCVFGPAK